MDVAVPEKPSFVCIHDGDCVRRLRAHDVVGALREVRRRSVRDWGWTLPASFNLNLDGGFSLALVVCATLTDDGVLIS